MKKVLVSWEFSVQNFICFSWMRMQIAGTTFIPFHSNSKLTSKSSQKANQISADVSCFHKVLFIVENAIQGNDFSSSSSCSSLLLVSIIWLVTLFHPPYKFPFKVIHRRSKGSFSRGTASLLRRCRCVATNEQVNPQDFQ